VPRKKKVGGVLRHTMQNLKKVARLPGKDRKEKSLRCCKRRFDGNNAITKSAQVLKQVDSDTGSSLASVNKDWENWMIMHGNEEVGGRMCGG
jgi:hypothetical protein